MGYQLTIVSGFTAWLELLRARRRKIPHPPSGVKVGGRKAKGADFSAPRLPQLLPLVIAAKVIFLKRNCFRLGLGEAKIRQIVVGAKRRIHA